MIAESELILKLVISVLLGSTVGIEREMHQSSAGMRTHALVALGATIFTIMSLTFLDDSTRIAAGIVTGIGFIGAGAIFRSENKVTGLTTAANLWVVAAIGLAVGIGYYYVAVAAAIIIIVILIVGRIFEKKALNRREH
ncbi:MAG: MgtC/SapB family protein [Candidatus Diapherotrites archaeon]